MKNVSISLETGLKRRIFFLHFWPYKLREEVTYKSNNARRKITSKQCHSWFVHHVYYFVGCCRFYLPLYFSFFCRTTSWAVLFADETCASRIMHALLLVVCGFQFRIGNIIYLVWSFRISKMGKVNILIYNIGIRSNAQRCSGKNIRWNQSLLLYLSKFVNLKTSCIILILLNSGRKRIRATIL